MIAAYAADLEPDVYRHLRAIAGRIHAERGRGQTIQPTALLHEAWEKVAKSGTEVGSRAHFMAVAAGAMRQILVDRARARMRQKRGGGLARTTLSGLGREDPAFEVVALHDAIRALGEFDARAAEVVVLRTFGGLSCPEVADALGVSLRRVERDWRFARAWLRERLD